MEQRKNTREAMEEAQARALDFDPKSRAQYVRDCIKQIEEYQAQRVPLDQIKTKMSIFIRDYNHLFEMVTKSNGYNKQDLKTMLAMLDRMSSGDLSQHQASIIVGKRLAEEYIKPE